MVKRIVLLVLCCLVLSVGVCSAKILKEFDEFSGGEKVTSFFRCEPDKNKIECIFFEQIQVKSLNSYSIGCQIETFQQFGLSDKSIEINIDGDFTNTLGVKKRQIMQVEKYLYMLEYQVSQEIVNKLKKSNRVALKFTQNNGNQFVYVLPDEVLTEWKQVINMDK